MVQTCSEAMLIELIDEDGNENRIPATRIRQFLSQAELLKLGHFRRFLHSSGLSQLDFLYRVEQLRKSREEESHFEVDEFGNPAYTPG